MSRSRIAAFQGVMSGRFWVITEVQLGAELTSARYTTIGYRIESFRKQVAVTANLCVGLEHFRLRCELLFLSKTFEER